ncbi:MAG: HAD-IA family hydrolase [Actinomycetota bacterium]|nr:HAD-IA family hydrolase [Actinomycetota bacterium]
MGPQETARAVVFDLLYTLVHPGLYPGGVGRTGWLADLLGVDVESLKRKWAAFEPLLEAGQSPYAPGTPPELAWVQAVADDHGVVVAESAWTTIERDWDLAQRTALLDPPEESRSTVMGLRERGFRLGLLSNTHALELRAWSQSPLAPLFDAVALSHDVGAIKPHAATYQAVLARLDMEPPQAVYVGDGSNEELAGARAAGFGLVVLADEAARRWGSAENLARLQGQADACVSSLPDLLTLLDATPQQR